LEFFGAGEASSGIVTSSPPNHGEARRLASAITAMDAGNYTTAVEILRRMAQGSKNPQVFRRLSMALYHTNRKFEAKKALERYTLLSRGRVKP
jgi:Flp pilus assembly protein TadD